jgi:lipoprotein Spr
MKTYWIITGSVFRFCVLIALLSTIQSCRSRKVQSEKNPWGDIEQKLGIKIEQLVDLAYYKEVVKWLGSPYKFGGNTPNGTDCSGFVTVVYDVVFGLALPRQSAQQSKLAKSIAANKLTPGDLYFFDINGKGISHVGMHLADDYFIHASTQKGVIVSSLKEVYYTKSFVGFGSFR